MQPAPLQTSTGTDPDGALLLRIADGDSSAFEPLMRRYNRRLYRVARSILRDDAEAEDALQDAYLQAFRALKGFRAESSLGTWLTRIVVNAALMRHRKARRMAKVIQMSIEPSAEPDMEERSDTQFSQQEEQPERAALRAQTRQLIEARIDALPEVFRTVFVLRALEELRVEETAATLGIPEATVRSRYFRARAMLREALSREIDFALEEAFAFDGARCDRIVSRVLRRLDQAG